MGFVKHIIVLLSVLGGSSGFAQTVPFQSKQELFQAFYAAGFDRIIEMEYGDFGENPFLIHTPQDRNDEGTQLRVFASHHDEIVRVPALDFMHGRMSYNKVQAEAYIYSEVFLCYKFKQNALQSFFSKGHQKFINCLVFPVKIMDVLKAVQSSSKQALPTGEKDDGRPTYGK